jgi:hypothetical protein
MPAKDFIGRVDIQGTPIDANSNAGRAVSNAHAAEFDWHIKHRCMAIAIAIGTCLGFLLRLRRLDLRSHCHLKIL